MFSFLSTLQPVELKLNFTPRHYVIAQTDKDSLHKVEAFEQCDLQCYITTNPHKESGAKLEKLPHPLCTTQQRSWTILHQFCVDNALFHYLLLNACMEDHSGVDTGQRTWNLSSDLFVCLLVAGRNRQFFS